jgi:hypothetical protein
MIITANLFFNNLSGFDDYKLRHLQPQFLRAGITEQGIDEKRPPIMAYVNHGKWLVKCECNGAEKAWEEGLMMCVSCLNATSGHQYRLSVFPESRVEIEKLLEMRRIPNRNWLPSETIEFLEQENIEHQDELL